MTDSELLNYPISADAALEPPAEWDELRSRCPVAHVRLASGDQATLVTRYDDVRTVLSDPRFGRGTGRKDAARVANTEDGGVFNSEMATVLPQDGEGHLAWRRLVGKWFTAKRMSALRPGITAMADQLVDEMVAAGHPVDLKAAFGFPLPVWVICDMLGVPDSDRHKFAHWSDCLLSMTRYTQDEMMASMSEFGAYMAHHVELKRTERGDDLLSELIDATDADGRPLSNDVLVATGQGLLVAGHETTANMITKMVAMLLADRSRWEQVLADPRLVRSTVEEALRYDVNAGFGMMRYIDAEIELSGVSVPSGTTVVCSMAAANRDEAAFEDAARLDLTRTPNPHLAFGAGAHSCLGQALARTELQIALETLLRRLPTLELAVDADKLTRVDGLAVGGLSELPVRW
ncbi:cytochrome P450 [Myceligenerans indicum]|uniref:Cytochrome P450 n=1 Tax=Myceligenerans indicum TaxID=2593663 RepID=A0ABS1LJX1_9MICO|nr:cytochrome P450 [Myceligenerans indicum]MBL0886545.1 cytochrome P450 [Myceligenerans indicum]